MCSYLVVTLCEVVNMEWVDHNNYGGRPEMMDQIKHLFISVFI